MGLIWSPGYAPVDEEFGNVSLLLHGDGTNGSTTIIDSSSNAHSVTAVGDAQISTAQSKFGGSSLAFDGTGDYLSIPNSSAFDLGLSNDPFTVEFWFYLNSSVVQMLFSKNGGYSGWNSNTGLQYAASVSDGKLYWQWNQQLASSIPAQIVSATLPAIQQWHHYAASYDGTTTRLFLNGVSVGTPRSDIYIKPSSADSIYVGSGVDINPYYLDGYIDDFRITKGVARYTSNFTPPTAPFPDLSASGRLIIADNSLDVDARQYIINVEEQDGQPLESDVRTAINDFVVGCKSDGIWSAIKASCILAGARTLDGALVPLVGTAPNKFGTEGNWNYNRETGLQGDGSTNYLDSNRNNNADPQNSKHVSVYQTSISSSDSILIGNSLGTGRTVLVSLSTTGISPRINADTAATAIGNGTGFVGGVRASSNTSTGRVNGTNYSENITSQSPKDESIGVFASVQPAAHGNPRLSFYSIGESLDLALLDTRVSTLMTDLAAAIP